MKYKKYKRSIFDKVDYEISRMVMVGVVIGVVGGTVIIVIAIIVAYLTTR